MNTHVLWLFIVHPHVLWFPHRQSHCDRPLPGGQGMIFVDCNTVVVTVRYFPIVSPGVQPTRRSAKTMLRGGPLSFCEATN